MRHRALALLVSVALLLQLALAPTATSAQRVVPFTIGRTQRNSRSDEVWNEPPTSFPGWYPYKDRPASETALRWQTIPQSALADAQGMLLYGGLPLGEVLPASGAAATSGGEGAAAPASAPVGAEAYYSGSYEEDEFATVGLMGWMVRTRTLCFPRMMRMVVLRTMWRVRTMVALKGLPGNMT